MRMYAIHNFIVKLWKKPYMRTIIRSSGKDCVLIVLFQLYGPKAGLLLEGTVF